MLNQSRSAQAEARVAKDEPLRLAFDIPPGDFNSYQWDLLDESGRRQSSSTISAQDAAHTIQLLLPAGTLAPGKYRLVIQGVNNSLQGNSATKEVARYSFAVQTKN